MPDVNPGGFLPYRVIGGFQDNIIATPGGGQSGAFALSTGAEVFRVNTVATQGDSVLLPPAINGLDVYVINHGANDMQVFGTGTDQIDDLASATGVAQMPGSLVLYSCTTTGKWYSNGLGTGFSGQYPTVSYQDNITAHAGGGQPSAFPLTHVINRITIVTTAADSVVLPAAKPGMQITVVNAAAANAANVFPATGEQIEALGANAAFSLVAAKTATFWCVGAGQWHKVLSA